MAILTDAKIKALLADPKPIRRSQVRLLKKPGKASSRDASERRLLVSGKSGRAYTVIVNRKQNPLYFSVIISCQWYGKHVNLIRCDCHKQPHTNQIEKSVIPSGVPHVHQATERYQRAGQAAESYADSTGDFFSCAGAIEFLCSRFGFYLSDDSYPTLYPLLGD